MVGSIWIFVSGFIVGGGIGLCVLGNSVVGLSVFWVIGSSGILVSINPPSVVSIIICNSDVIWLGPEYSQSSISKL